LLLSRRRYYAFARHYYCLRHKLQRVSKDGVIVRSIYGVGYKLELVDSSA
jgi:hypothetical protein